MARAVAAIAVAFVVAATAPALALAVGPVVLGVPHVASSLRYNVLRNGHARGRVLVIAAFAVAIVATRIGEPYAAAGGLAPVEVGLGVGLSALAIVAAWVDGRRAGRAAIGCAALVACGAIAMRHAATTRLALVHVHNLGVVALWWVVWRRDRRRGPAWVLLALVAALAGLCALSGSGRAPSAWGARALSVDVAEVGAWLAPGAATGVASSLVLAHAFTDSVHYAFWLGVIPEETLSAEGTPTFRMTVRALRRDFGPRALACVAFVAIVIAVYALVDLGIARRAYFVLAGFHGHVEAAALVYALVRGRRVDHPPSRMQMRPTNAMSVHLGNAPAQSAPVTHSSVQ